MVRSRCCASVPERRSEFVASGNQVSWRRVFGAIVMVPGALLAMASAVLAATVIYHFVEWENAADALSTVGMVTGPLFAAGSMLILLGRWIYGDWRVRLPVRTWAGIVFKWAGLGCALVFAGLLLWRLFVAAAPEQTGAIIQYTVALVSGLALLQVGLWVRPARSGRVA